MMLHGAAQARGTQPTTGLPPLPKEHQQPARQADFPTPSPPHQPIVPASSRLSAGVKKQVQEHRTPTTLQPSTLRHIVPADLQDTGRLLTLFAQAQTQGLLGKSDNDRLTFLALAEHAQVVGSQNPCGLFAALVQRQHWHFVIDSDEDVAQVRLKTYLYGAAARAAPPPAAAPLALSPDAALCGMCARSWPGPAGTVRRLAS